MGVKLSALDKFANAVSPSWGNSRMQNKIKAWGYQNSGYITPSSPRKSMKGTVVNPLSPDSDVIPKLKGSRALSRDLAMNSPIAISTLRRRVINVIGAELKLQSRIDGKFLGLGKEQVDAFKSTLELEFDMWAENFTCDFDNAFLFGELQSLIYFNMLLNGDVFFMLPWRANKELPYEMSVKLIDSDLVRDPETGVSSAVNWQDKDIKGGVEKNKRGQVVAYWVANYYENDCTSNNADLANRKFKRIPIYDSNGKRQIWHFMAAERIGQRRGMPIFAPVLDALKQITRISDAEMTNLLVSALFTVFVKDMSGFGSLMQEGFTPEETVTGGGGLGPDAPQEDKAPGDEFDIEMGAGNINYLDDKKEITIADPNKSDEGFDKFFNVLAKQVCSATGTPIEQVFMHFQTSYTAAKAATNEAWKSFRVDRLRIDKKFCSVVVTEFIREGILKGRLVAPGFFDDAAKRYAYSKSNWVGPGQGQLNPKDEAQAAVIKINNKISTREEEYMKDTGGRWDSAMGRYAEENELLDELGIADEQDTREIVGADGQKEPSEIETEGATE